MNIVRFFFRRLERDGKPEMKSIFTVNVAKCTRVKKCIFYAVFQYVPSEGNAGKKNRDAANTRDFNVCTSNLTISLAEAIAEPLPERMRAGC